MRGHTGKVSSPLVSMWPCSARAPCLLEPTVRGCPRSAALVHLQRPPHALVDVKARAILEERDNSPIIVEGVDAPFPVAEDLRARGSRHAGQSSHMNANVCQPVGSVFAAECACTVYPDRRAGPVSIRPPPRPYTLDHEASCAEAMQTRHLIYDLLWIWQSERGTLVADRGMQDVAEVVAAVCLGSGAEGLVALHPQA